MPVKDEHFITRFPRMIHGKRGVKTYVPTYNKVERQRCIIAHQEKVLRYINYRKAFLAGIDRHAPITTKTKLGTLVAFKGEDLDLYRLRVLIANEGIEVPIIVRDTTRSSRFGDKARVVIGDVSFPITLSPTPQIAEVAHNLREAVYRATILWEHFIDEQDFLVSPQWAQKEVLYLMRRINRLQQELKFLGLIAEDGDLVLAEKRAKRHAKLESKRRDRIRYGITKEQQDDSIPYYEPTFTHSWILCYCPHLNN